MSLHASLPEKPGLALCGERYPHFLVFPQQATCRRCQRAWASIRSTVGQERQS